eukprot:scaffold98_cov244-Pinguiococcus_pyrenoidosus.AAC.4
MSSHSMTPSESTIRMHCMVRCSSTSSLFSSRSTSGLRNVKDAVPVEPSRLLVRRTSGTSSSGRSSISEMKASTPASTPASASASASIPAQRGPKGLLEATLGLTKA